VTYVQAHVSTYTNSSKMLLYILSNVLQVSSTSALPTFSVLKHIKFPYNILSFHVSMLQNVVLSLVLILQWLTSQLAVLMDSKEFVYIIHVRSAAVLQVSSGEWGWCAGMPSYSL